MSKLDELLGKAAEETVDRAAQEAIEEQIPNANVEKIWDDFRRNFRGTEIREQIHQAANKQDAREVLIAKLKNMSLQAERLIPILKEVMQKAEDTISGIENETEDESNGGQS